MCGLLEWKSPNTFHSLDCWPKRSIGRKTEENMLRTKSLIIFLKLPSASALIIYFIAEFSSAAYTYSSKCPTTLHISFLIPLSISLFSCVGLPPEVTLFGTIAIWVVCLLLIAASVFPFSSIYLWWWDCSFGFGIIGLPAFSWSCSYIFDGLMIFVWFSLCLRSFGCLQHYRKIPFNCCYSASLFSLIKNFSFIYPLIWICFRAFLWR